MPYPKQCFDSDVWYHQSGTFGKPSLCRMPLTTIALLSSMLCHGSLTSTLIRRYMHEMRWGPKTVSHSSNSTRRLRFWDLLQEDKSLLVAIESIAESELPADATPLSHKHKKRHRADVMPGSSIRFEALPPKTGRTLLLIMLMQVALLLIHFCILQI